MNQPKALIQRLEKLGQDGVGNYGMPICAEAAAELRRLHALNAELLDALKRISGFESVESTEYGELLQVQKIARAAIAKAEGEQK